MISRRSSNRPAAALLVASAVLIIAVLAGGVAAATHSARSAGSASFSDAVGDATGGAADLRTLAVSDDPATGTIMIQVTAAGYSTVPAALYPQIRVYLDTDENASTGDPWNAGTEYRLIVERQPSGRGVWNLSHWDGDAWAMVAQSSAWERRDGDVVTWTVTRGDLGGTTGFCLFAASHVFVSATPSGMDSSPEGLDTWSYQLTKPSTTGPGAGNLHGRAGRGPFSQTVGRSDRAGPCPPGARGFGAAPPDTQAPTVERFEAGHALLRRGGGRIPEVALTFDDGPSASTTALLSLLESYRAKATFFVVGRNIPAYQEALAAAAAAGDEIGNHSWSHPYLTALAPAALARELSETSQEIRSATGVTPILMRPPAGIRNTAVDAAITRGGMIEALWSVDPRDWASDDADAIARTVLASAVPGAVILLHDGHPATVAALPRILDGLQARGLRPVTITRLLADDPPTR